MNDNDVAEALHEVREAIGSLTVGLTRMLAIQARQTDMLKEILAAVTAKPSGPSPLQGALEAIFATLVRMEGKIDKLSSR